MNPPNYLRSLNAFSTILSIVFFMSYAFIKLSSFFSMYIKYSIFPAGPFIGEIVSKKGIYTLLTKDIASKDVEFVVNHSEVSLFDGYIVRGVIAKETKTRVYIDVVSIIGHKNDPGVDIERIIRSHDADIEFPLEVREQLKSIPSKLFESRFFKFVPSIFTTLLSFISFSSNWS